MENITTSETPPVEKPAEENRINLSDVKITDQNVALNVLVGFLNIAQRRGAFGMDEAAKIWEAVKYFVVTNTCTCRWNAISTRGECNVSCRFYSSRKRIQ